MKTKKLNIVLIIAIALIFAACDDGNKTPPFTPEYALGDTGPGGGKIFYISESGFTMTDNDKTCHYLEAASADMSTTLAWASSLENIVGTEAAIGTGRKNTIIILATDNTAPAAKACYEYSNNGKTDWFLPSKDELDMLYKNMNHVSNLKTTVDTTNWTHWYWSSSYIDNDFAWSHIFSDGNTNYGGRYAKLSVRAIRAF